MTKELQLLFDTSDRVLTEGSFFCINPITKGENKSQTEAKSWRNDLNVCTYRNFLFEIDSLPLDVQKNLVSHLVVSFPIRTVTYSGGKSYHIIISVSDSLPFKVQTNEGTQAYKDLWTGLCDALEQSSRKFLGITDEIFDRSTKNCSRLSRIPNGLRDGAIKQELVYTGLLASSDFLLKYYKERTRDVQLVVDQNDALDVDEFKTILNKPEMANLRILFTLPQLWVKPVNMYPELLRISLWCIDATGVPKKTLLNYLRLTVLPAMLEVGYDASKWDKGVHAAYDYKGL